MIECRPARDVAGAHLVQLTQHLAGVTDALADLEAQVARDDRLRLDPLQVVHARVVGAHDLEHVPKPCRGHRRGLRQLSLQQRVEHHGRAVHEIVDVGERDTPITRVPSIRQDPLDAAEHAFLEVAGRGQGLRDVHAAARIQQHQIGEGAADVRGKPGAHRTARGVGPMALATGGAKSLRGSRHRRPAGRHAGISLERRDSHAFHEVTSQQEEQHDRGNGRDDRGRQHHVRPG